MNWSQLKDPVCNMCLAGAVASSSLTQKMASWQVQTLLPQMTNIFVTEFSENI